MIFTDAPDIVEKILENKFCPSIDAKTEWGKYNFMICCVNNLKIVKYVDTRSFIIYQRGKVKVM